jgi:hypothetical protein
VPPEAVSLALVGSIYPPAVAAVIAFGRGEDVRRRVVAFVLTAWVTVLVVGVLLLTVLKDLNLGSREHTSLGPGVDLAAGVAALGLAVWLRRPRRPAPEPVASGGPSRTERYLQSARLACVLGFTLYVVPSPIYIGAITAIAGTNASTTDQGAYLVILVVIMLWMVEVPMLALVVAPERASAALDRINRWFARHGRELAVLASFGAGIYLIVKGLSDLLS